jgi:hypothetical protein
MNKFRPSGSAFTLEHPIVLSRRAARIFGLDVAVVAQQFVYWTLDQRCSLAGKVDADGLKWVYFSGEQLAQEFDWISKSTVKRIISLLEDCGFLISRQTDCYSPKEYRVSQGIFMAVEAGKFDRLDHETRKLIPSTLDQNEPTGPLVQNELTTLVQIEPTTLTQNESATNTYHSSPNSLPNTHAAGSAKPRVGRPRNPLMDALAAVECEDLTKFNKAEWAKIAKAKQLLVESNPAATPDDVKRLRLAYIKMFPNSAVTAMAIASNYAKLWASLPKPPPPQPQREENEWTDYRIKPSGEEMAARFKSLSEGIEQEQWP